MSILVRFDQVALEFGDQPLLKQVDFTIEQNERICLIGRNGCGKSSLLKLINGQLQADSGELHYSQNIRIASLAQQLPHYPGQTVRDIILAGLADLNQQIIEYQRLTEQAQTEHQLAEIAILQQAIETHGGWQPMQQAEAIMTQLELPGDCLLDELSGGWQRRVALGKALVAKPDLLLLDEPTNHLDISTIEWLEQELHRFTGSLLFVTHDRRFLQALATRILELDRGRLSSWPGDYQNYLRRKAEQLDEEARHNELFDKKLAQEEAWIRQGIKARRTRNEGRVRALEAMRETKAQQLKPQKPPRMHLESADPSGRKVIEARNISHGYNGELLLKDFSIKIMRGERIGLIGNNGVGKSTLLRILLGQLTPQQGTVKLGTQLEIGYFDQMRRELEENKTIAEAVGNGKDYIKLYGKDRHIIGYLKDFLFSAKRAMTPIKVLSGGERNRVILAKLFTRPVNLLVLDEPTNDLDMEMLDALEARLQSFTGTLIIVSHDRDFLDNVVDRILVFEADGSLQDYVGNYSDWQRRGHELAIEQKLANTSATLSKLNSDSNVSKKTKKLSYKLQLELDQLPDKIQQLEQQLAALQEKINVPEFYQQPHDKIQPILDTMTAHQQELEQVMYRWDSLEKLAAGK